MAIWKDTSGQLHDDMGGAALTLPGWPSNATQLTDEELDGLNSPKLEEVKSAKLAELQMAYATAANASISLTTGTGRMASFQADGPGRDAIAQSFQGFSAAGEVPAGFFWLSDKNEQVPFSLEDLRRLCESMSNQVWEAFQRLQDRKAKVRDAGAVDEVSVISW